MNNKKRPGNVLVEWLKCGSQFKRECKPFHETKYHAGKSVQIKNVGAPDNTFVAAKKLKYTSSSSESLTSTFHTDEVIEVDIPCLNEHLDSQSKELDSRNSVLLDTDDIGTSCSAASSCLELVYLDPDTSGYNTKKDVNVKDDAATLIVSDHDYGIQVAAFAKEYIKNVDSKVDMTSADSQNELPGGVDKQNFELSQEETRAASSSLWLNCLVSLDVLVSQLDSAKHMLNNLKGNEVEEEYFSVLQVSEMADEINEACKKVTASCQAYFKPEKNSHFVAHDPGLRLPIKSQKERNYLIKLGPHQPLLDTFPSNGNGRFNPQWYKEFEFIEYSTVNDSAYCFVCFLFPNGLGRNKPESFWAKDGGVRNWRRMKSSGANKPGKLELHFNSLAHKASLGDYRNLLATSLHIDVLLNKRSHTK